MNTPPKIPSKNYRTGVVGLDRILQGGLEQRCLFLAYGRTGTGKTTLGLQFLREGLTQGQSGLFISFSETKAELESVAESHGWSLKGIEIHDAAHVFPGKSEAQTVFPPAEVELQNLLQPVLEIITRMKPNRVVVDSLAEIRIMAVDQGSYRRELRNLKEAFLKLGCTVLLLDDQRPEAQEMGVESLLHGIIVLEQTWPDYGRVRRRLHVVKMRAARYLEGYHDMAIATGGLSVYPRLIATNAPAATENRRLLSTGLAEWDELLGGGFETGTSVLIVGPAGSGKSNLATQVLHAAARRGEQGALFGFEETLATTFARSRAIGLPLEDDLKAGRLRHESVDPAELSAGESAAHVMDSVDHHGTSIVVIDSLNGYLEAMTEERSMALQLHELLVSLSQRGVLSLVLLTEHGILQPYSLEAIKVSYLADTVVGLQYFEDAGRVRRAISVLKKRTGGHKDTIHEFMTDGTGLRIGPPLKDFDGMLSGHLTHRGASKRFMTERS